MFKKLIAVFFAFLAAIGAAGFANAQEYADTLRLVRGTDGMTIELKKKTTNGAGTAFYLYDEVGYWNTNNKRQNMDAVGYILGLGGDGELIHDNNRSRIMNEPSTGRNYRVSLPTLGELRNLRNVHGGLPRQWNGYLDGGPEFLTATKNGYHMHQTLDLANGQHNTRWNSGERVVTFMVQEEVSDNRVCFYEHTNYQGKSKCFTGGNYTDLGNYPSEGGPAANTFSSVKLSVNCSSVNIREGASTSSFGTAVTQDKPNFFSESMNDKATAVTVTCPPAFDLAQQNPYTVCLFEHTYYRGRSKCFDHGNYRSVGNYDDGTSANDTFSSISVGWACTRSSFFYTDGTYGGGEYNISAGNAGYRVPALSLYGYDDSFSSLKINCPRPY